MKKISEFQHLAWNLTYGSNVRLSSRQLESILKTSLAVIVLAAIASTASAQTYRFQTINGQTVLVPQGVIKSGPKSYSKSDPANPYRAGKDHAGKSGYGRAVESQLPVVNTNGNHLAEPRGIIGRNIIVSPSSGRSVNPYYRP